MRRLEWFVLLAVLVPEFAKGLVPEAAQQAAVAVAMEEVLVLKAAMAAGKVLVAVSRPGKAGDTGTAASCPGGVEVVRQLVQDIGMLARKAGPQQVWLAELAERQSLVVVRHGTGALKQ